MFKIIGIMGLGILALFAVTLWQAREIGERNAQIAAHKAVEEYKAATQAEAQAAIDEAAEKTEAAKQQLEQVTNERDRYRLVADREALKNPLGFGDAFERDLALWMRCVADEDRQACRLYPTGAEPTGGPDRAGPE